MKKTVVSALTIALAASTATAAIPVVEQASKAAKTETGKPALYRSAKQAMMSKTAQASANTFFEGFEERPEGMGDFYDEWLPAGWEDVSKSGQTVPEEGEYRHNLTWRVMSNDSRSNSPTCFNYSYEGECFAFIMADVAYDDYVDLKTQDEWLITPAVTPQTEDWMFFRLCYNAAWTVYNRTANDFTGLNNSLEVYVTVDEGKTWDRLWSLVEDEIRPNWTDEQLREELINWSSYKYTPIFVNIEKYIGKSVKFAFRYFGKTGHPVYIDNVAVGVPQPEASYRLPAGFMKQGLSPNVEYPAVPTLLAPFNTEATWVNTSESSLAYEWTFADATGSDTTSAIKDLTTPAYPYGTVVDTPSLVGIFESHRSEPYQQNHYKMQAGGVLTGEDSEGNKCEFGVGGYDIADPEHKIQISSNYMAFQPDLDLAWEMLLGQPDGVLETSGLCNLYLASPRDWGFDFVDIAAYVTKDVLPESETVLTVYIMDDSGNPAAIIGQSVLTGSEIPVNTSAYVNLHFTFDVPVFVPAGYDIITLLTHSNRDDDTIVFPYVKTRSSIYGNSLVYFWAWDTNEGGWYETFYNLNSFPLNDGYHFAGLLQSVGAAYSSMELIGSDDEIVAPKEGITKEFKVRTSLSADRIAVTEFGVVEPEWISYTVIPGNDGVHTVKITVLPATTSDDLDTTLQILTPGSRVGIHVTQEGDPAGIIDVATGAGISVTTEGGDIVVDGAEGLAEVYNVSGAKVATANVSGRTAIPASHMANGVYMVRVNGKSFKVVK